MLQEMPVMSSGGGGVISPKYMAWYDANKTVTAPEALEYIEIYALSSFRFNNITDLENALVNTVQKGESKTVTIDNGNVTITLANDGTSYTVTSPSKNVMLMMYINS
jgi:hypothetical protein